MKHIRNDYNQRIQDNQNIIPEDEPVMLFRGQDKHLPAILRHYAFLLRKDGNEEMAEQISNWVPVVVDWQYDNKRKQPDCPKQMLLFR